MAEGLWNELGKGEWDAYSAGSRPSGYVHPLAIRAMKEIGLDIAGYESKQAADFQHQPFDLVITVCDNAKEDCPIYPEAKETLHWPFEDPADATGSDDEKMVTFRRIRDEIKAFYEMLLGTKPSKTRPRYAKFEPVDPSVNLSLNQIDEEFQVEQGSAHFGIQVKSVAEVHAAADRFKAAGAKVMHEEATTCCYAVQDKVWVADPDGHKWEIFVVLDADAKDETVDRQDEHRTKAVLQIYIPFYRDREKLERAIESVQRQTSSDVQLTVLDDASETFADGANDFCEQYPDIRYSRNPQNLGMVGNWNRSFEDDSPMLSILHADDELLPDYAEAMQDAAAKYPEASLLFCWAKIIDDKGRELFSFPDYVKRFLYSQKGDVTLAGEEAVASLLRGNYIFCPTVAFQVENLNGIRFDPRWRFVQDLDFVLR
ncbi:arsC, partial [Symbiodinium sp. CCMP2456]